LKLFKADDFLHLQGCILRGNVNCWWFRSRHSGTWNSFYRREKTSNLL